MSITKPVTENKLTFKVIKKKADGANVESATYDYQLPTQIPQITRIDCQTSEKKPLTRGTSAPGKVSCMIKGTFLAGGTPVLVNGDSFANPTRSVDRGTPNDSELHFSMTLNQPVIENLQFRVDKKLGDGPR